MTTDQLKEKAYLDSGCIKHTEDGYMCTVCGRSSYSVMSISHMPECELYTTVDQLDARLHSEATLGETDISQSTVLEIMSSVTMPQIQMVDAFMDKFAQATTVEDRITLMHQIFEMLPNADKELMLAFVFTGIADKKQYNALRLAILFELGIGRRESDMRKELQQIQKEFEGAEKTLKAIKLSDITASIK